LTKSVKTPVMVPDVIDAVPIDYVQLPALSPILAPASMPTHAYAGADVDVRRPRPCPRPTLASTGPKYTLDPAKLWDSDEERFKAMGMNTIFMGSRNPDDIPQMFYHGIQYQPAGLAVHNCRMVIFYNLSPETRVHDSK
jgi:hypothetical protein